MQDAFGGIVNLFLIAVFLVIVEGILGFTVNYTKAFKMKNIVISALEEYEDASCISGNEGTACRKKIKEGAIRIGYSPTTLRCPSDFEKIDGFFCVKEVKDNRSDINKNNKIYRVITQVDVNMPIVRDILSFSFFQVSGDTRVIHNSNS